MTRGKRCRKEAYRRLAPPWHVTGGGCVCCEVILIMVYCKGEGYSALVKDNGNFGDFCQSLANTLRP